MGRKLNDREKEMRQRVINALNNSEKLSEEELRKVRDEVLTFADSLGDRRGAFLWKSGFEVLDMIVD